MVPKIISSPLKVLTMDNEDSSQNSGAEDDYESDDELENLDDNEDFLKAVNGAETSKRKRVEVEDEAVDGDKAMVTTDLQALPKKKKKKKKQATVDMKPPTAEEMIRLRETENLFHSNLFRMQIEEMIKELRPKKAEKKQIKPWLESLKELLLGIDDSDAPQLNDRALPSRIKSPLPHLPHEEGRVSTTFRKPLSVSVTGSYHVGCCLGPGLSIDVVVVMPKKCFLKEDYLNGRYHCKRVAYLGHLASALLGSELVESVRWSACGGPLSPRLNMCPAGGSQVQVYVSAVPQPNTFKLSRFTPDKSNVRQSWLTACQEKDNTSPTPIYNTSVMQDLVWSSNENIRQQCLENNNNVKDAITLLRVWLKQRQLDSKCGGFTGFLASMLVVALLQSRRINSLMSSYQIIRNVWLVLSQSNWTKEGFTMCTTKREQNAPSLEDFHCHFDVVFVDTTGYCNLAANLDRLTYYWVKQEAELAVQCLDNPDMNSFQALFITPMPFLRQFDHVVCLKKFTKAMARVLKNESSEMERTNHFASEYTLFNSIVMSLLERGLGGRVDQLVHQLPSVPQWNVSETPPQSESTLVIGMRLNSETAYSVVEKGPPANEPQAAEFRALWGKRCELRRFRDGTVSEAVVWAKSDVPLAQRRMITRQMTQSLLTGRLGLPVQAVTYLASQLEPLVEEKAFKPDGFAYGSGEEASIAVVRAWDLLVKQLRELPDLPLDVASVHGVSAVFRGAEVFPPLARLGRPQAKIGVQADTCWVPFDSMRKAPEYIAPVEGVLQLGLSRKWPEDVEAVRRIRAAFNLHIASALTEQCDLQTQPYADYIHVFKEGFVFRIRIIYPREVALLKQSTMPDGKLCYRDTPESLELEKYSIHLPKLTGALHGLQQQHPGFSVACRLAKRWLSSQLLDSSHVPELAVELLMASLFLAPEPFRVLTQPQPMFLRFLHMLANTNWHLEPVIVNFNGDLKREDLVDIESRFRSERVSLPPLFIATQYDKSGSVWTREAPSLPVLVRLASLAQQSLSVLETNFLSSATFEGCKVVFRPPLELYDALIQLKPILLPRVVHAVDFSSKDPSQLHVSQERKKIPITGFDPAQCYLQELRESYSDYALFFHDTYGGKTIGVLFKPSAFENQDFKVSHVNCRKPVKEGKKTLLELNLDAIIEDFYVLGAGLVRTIDLSPQFSKKLQ